MNENAAHVLATALRDTLFSPNESDRNGEDANVVDGLFAIARSLNRIADQLKALGTGDAASPMGAMEYLAKEVGEAGGRIATALERRDA